MNTISESVVAEKPAETSRSERFMALLPDPVAIVAVLKRRYLWFVLPFLAMMGLAVAYLAVAKPRYLSTSSIVIEPRATDNVAPVTGQTNNAAIPLGSDEVDTQVELLGSPAIAGRVAAALHLENYPEYRLPGPVTYSPAEPSTHPLAGRLLQHVSIRRSGLTYIVSITASSSNAELSSRIANAFAEQFLAARDEQKENSTRQASTFLSSRLDKLRDAAVPSDAALQRYKVDHGLMSAQGSTVAEQEVSDLNQEIAKARADYAEKEGRLAAARGQISRGSGGADVQAALQSQTITELRSKEAEASRTLADLTSRYGPLYPDVIKQKQVLDDTRAQVRAEISRITSSLEAEAKASGSRLASLTASQARANSALSGNGTAQVALLELQRKAEVSSAIYQAYLNRSKETISREGLERADVRIDTLSTPPTLPFSPRVPVILGAGFISGLLLGLLGVGIAEYLDRGLNSKSDVERWLRVRYLAGIPELESTLDGLRTTEAPQDYILSHPHSSFAEVFRVLRTNLTGSRAGASQVLAVTSPLPREGKSTTSICLARSCAAAGLRTVLVDGDVRRRTVSQMLLPDNADGLVRYVFGQAGIEDAIVVDAASGLSVLGSNVAPEGGREMFVPDQISRLLGDLRTSFDLVIIDTAPALALAETASLAAAADAVLLVVKWRSTSRQAADTTIEMLLSAKAKLKGVALSMVDLRRVGSTNADEMHAYHKKFKGYYVN